MKDATSLNPLKVHVKEHIHPTHISAQGKKTNKKGLLLWCVVIFRPTEDNVTDQQIFFAICTRLSSQTLNSEVAALPRKLTQELSCTAVYQQGTMMQVCTRPLKTGIGWFDKDV